MQKYHIESIGNSVILYNDDEDPIIKTITFKISADEKSTLSRRIELKFVSESSESSKMREQFIKVSGKHRQVMGYESIDVEKEGYQIIKFLKIVQTIDPIPTRAFVEVRNKIDYNFSPFIFPGLVAQQQHEDALKEALTAFYAGDEDSLLELASLYESKQDRQNYLNVLENIPPQHSSFIEVNKEIHALLSEMGLEEEEPDYAHLERLLRAAIHARHTEAAGKYFDKLRGNSGEVPSIHYVDANPNLLIVIAQEQRALQQELKRMKAEVEAKKADPKEEKKVNPHSIFGGFGNSDDKSPTGDERLNFGLH